MKAKDFDVLGFGFFGYLFDMRYESVNSLMS